jgi:predicted RNase H-like nuclease (RuvC/YqgF family)
MANELSEAERMTKFETQLENLLVVVSRMDAKMDTWQANFVSKELLEEKLKARDERINRLESEKASHKNVLPLWAAAIVAAISLIISIWPHVK